MTQTTNPLDISIRRKETERERERERKSVILVRWDLFLSMCKEGKQMLDTLLA